MTYREKLAHEHPDHIDKSCPGGVNGCPHMFGYEIPYPCDEITDDGCRKCWDREIPYPTPILDEAIDPLHITFYPANIPNPDEMLANVINTASAIKDRPVYITIM